MPKFLAIIRKTSDTVDDNSWTTGPVPGSPVMLQIRCEVVEALSLGDATSIIHRLTHHETLINVSQIPFGK